MLAKTIAAAALVASAAPLAAAEIFHGTSILIQPDWKNAHPANHKLQTASFYCFMGDEGYFSFGWWLGANGTNMDNSHVKPNPQLNLPCASHEDAGFDWFEIGVATPEAGRYTATNYRAHLDPRTEEPTFEEPYVVKGFQIGEGERGAMMVSYFDRDQGTSAVGVRETLTGKQCNDAFETFARIRKSKGLELAFDFKNPCNGARAANEIEHIPGGSKFQKIFEL